MSTNLVDAGAAAAPPGGLLASMPVADAPDEPGLGVGLALLRNMIQSPRFVPIMDRSWFDFMAERGRIPFVHDDPPPWHYMGWLLWQVWMASHHPSVPARWPFYMNTLAAGRLTDERIPRINFAAHSPAHAATKKALEKILEKLGRVHGYGERALTVFVDWLAFGLGADKTRPDYINAETNEWLYRTFDVSAWLLHPYDVLGDLLEESRGRSKRYTGFFLSPPTICEFMARSLFVDDEKDYRHLTAHEPAVGTGRMLLAISNYSMRLTGTDIDPVCVKIARCNGALWAPWMTFPLPKFFFDDSVPLSPITFPQPAIIQANGLTYGLAPEPAEGERQEEGAEVEFAPVEGGDDAPAHRAAEEEPPAARRAKRTPVRLDDTSQGLLFDAPDSTAVN